MTIEELLQSIDAKLGRLIELAEQSTPRPRKAPDDVSLTVESPAEEAAKPVGYALHDVREALVRVNEAIPHEGLKVLKRAGGVDTLGELRPEKFAAVIHAAREACEKSTS